MMKKKTFAFKLATKAVQQNQAQKKWSGRNGVASAGCSQVMFGDYRADHPSGGWDNGVYC